MLTATLLALGAAGLHAAWNLVVKQSGDRWTALWAQSLVAGVIATIVLVMLAAAGHAPPLVAWRWAAISGGVQLAYLILLGRAYDHGDFSVSYPIARGGGALVAAAGGVVLLDDHLSPLGMTGIGVAMVGLGTLAVGQRRVQVVPALLVAAAIGTYTLVDAHGSRQSDTASYALVVFVTVCCTTTAWGLARGGGGRLVAAMRSDLRRYVFTGIASSAAYGMVLLAVRDAPVGYVTALRESSVVLAALAGWRFLGEGDSRRRLTAAAVVLAGLVLLVAAS